MPVPVRKVIFRSPWSQISSQSSVSVRVHRKSFGLTGACSIRKQSPDFANVWLQIEAKMTAIYITERDIEALSRLAYAEARSIAAISDKKAAYGSIVDAVLNRVMTGQGYLAADDFGNMNITGAINKD